MDFCSEEQVTRIFNQLVGKDMVTKVTTLRKKNEHNGYGFKIFFIEFAKSNEALDEIVSLIKSDPNPDENKRHTCVTYDAQDHFWKVSMARKKEKEVKEEFVPRIIKREEGEV